MEPLALNANKLALALRVSAPGVYEIIYEERDISPEMALRLARCLGTSPEFWLNLQTRFDLEIARDKAQRRVDQEVQPIAK
jgi:addiction module HigA family antidote